MIGVISLCYLIEMVLVKPVWGDVLYHAVVPQLAGPESIVLAAGILGATVMPHVIFLHSSLTQKRIVVRTPARLRKLFRFELVDVVVAMGLAGLINAAMLIMAAATFYNTGLTSVATIQDAHLTLAPLLGKASSIFFALSLLASGLSSSSVGTMAGQVIMQGFLRREIPVWIRRTATMIPALIVILIGLDPTRTLILSQVVLSFGLPFAIIPLVIFTSRRKLMKTLVNLRITTLVACLVTAVIVSLNIYLLIQIFAGI